MTLVFHLRGEIAGRPALAYALVQLTAGILGVWAAHLMFDLPVLQLSLRSRSGAGQWLGEFVATFGLVLTILGTLRSNPKWIPASVGLYIAAAYWFTSSTSFANPAITVARSLSDSFAGIAPIDVPGFIAAQLAGRWRRILPASGCSIDPGPPPPDLSLSYNAASWQRKVMRRLTPSTDSLAQQPLRGAPEFSPRTVSTVSTSFEIRALAPSRTITRENRT